MLDARNRLIGIMTTEFYEIVGSELEESEKLCRQLLDENKYETAQPSEILQSKELILKDCIDHVMEQLEPTMTRRAGGPDHALFIEYGLKDILHALNRRRSHFIEENVRRIDEYVNSLSPKQQRKAIARNLARWSIRMKRATKVTRKMWVFRSLMRFYYFESGV